MISLESFKNQIHDGYINKATHILMGQKTYDKLHDHFIKNNLSEVLKSVSDYSDKPLESLIKRRLNGNITIVINPKMKKNTVRMAKWGKTRRKNVKSLRNGRESNKYAYGMVKIQDIDVMAWDNRHKQGIYFQTGDMWKYGELRRECEPKTT